MEYDLHLVGCTCRLIGPLDGARERKMLDRVAFMQHRKLFRGIVDNPPMARVGADQYERALALPHVRADEFHQPADDWIYVHGTKREPHPAWSFTLDRIDHSTRDDALSEETEESEPRRPTKKPVTKQVRQSRARVTKEARGCGSNIITLCP